MALIPLESNPDVMNKSLEMMGVPTNWKICDVLGLDDDSLSWVPKPALAVLLLFPCSDQYEAHRKQEDEELKKSGQQISDKIFYMKQTIQNACGTVAILHGIANNVDKIQLADGKFKKFLEEAKDLDPEARGALLEASSEVMSAHLELAKEGQSLAPGADDPVYHHFIVFVQKDGNLYELDGRKSFPINHGPSSPETLLADAAKICKVFMARDPADVNFTVLALAASE